jgi:hypothetical protein
LRVLDGNSFVFTPEQSLNDGQTDASEAWEAIVQFVAAVWDSVELSTAFENTWMRLARGLRLNEDNHGGNELVET